MSHLPSPSQNNLPPPPLPPASSLPPPPGVAAPPPRAFPIPPPLLSETSSAELARREQQQQQQLPPPQAQPPAQPPAQKKFIPPAPKLLSETSSAELDHASNPAPVAAPHPPPTLKPGIKAPPLLSETSSAELSKLEDPSKRRNSAEIQRNIQRHDSTSNRATLAAGAVKPITAPEEPPKKVEEDRKAAIKQGYLMKRSDLLGKWERFYFTVRNDGWMKYYKDENFKLGTSKGALDLRHAVFNDEPDKFPKKSKLCFSIFSRNRCTYFIVESDEKEYNEWAEAIRFIIRKQFS